MTIRGGICMLDVHLEHIVRTLICTAKRVWLCLTAHDVELGHSDRIPEPQ